MAKLDGKIVFIPGGTGNVGEGLVRSFLKVGAIVITSSRKQQSLDQLRSDLGALALERFVPIVGDLADFASAETLRDQILAKFQRLDAVVASLGSTWHGNQPLTQVSMADWQHYLTSNLTTHFVCARTFLPVLEQMQRSSYTLLGGSAAETPVPFYGLVGVPAAAQLMLAKVLMAEMKDSSVRINEVMINSLVNTRETRDKAEPEWITANEIGDYVAWLTSDEAYMVRSSVPHLQPQLRK